MSDSSVTIPAWLSEALKETERVVLDCFERTGHADFKNLLLGQHLGGKRLRPMIVAASAGLGERPSDAVPNAAAAVELFHLATLFHDDILDEPSERRHHATADRFEGSHRALLAGDYLLAEALGLLVRHLPHDTASFFIDTVKTIVRSEILASKTLHRTDVSDTEYLEIIHHKTASLFGFSASLGIRLTSEQPERIEALARFGAELGTAYQLADDLEDLMGLVDGSDNDLRRGYWSLPVIELLKRIPLEDRTHVLQHAEAADETSRQHLLQLMKRFSVFPHLGVRTRKHLHEAEKALDFFGRARGRASDSRDLLLDLCHRVHEKWSRLIRAYDKLAEQAGRTNTRLSVA